MATIRKTPSGKWNVQVRRGGKLLKSTTFRSHEAATAWAEDQERLFRQEHSLFIDAGYAYCHEVLDGKPSQSLALNRIDRVGQHKVMRKTLDLIMLQGINTFKQTRLAKVATTNCRDELMMIHRVYRWYISEHLAETGTILRLVDLVLLHPRRLNEATDGR